MLLLDAVCPSFFARGLVASSVTFAARCAPRGPRSGLSRAIVHHSPVERFPNALTIVPTQEQERKHALPALGRLAPAMR
jgi:hypothetical protein